MSFALPIRVASNTLIKCPSKFVAASNFHTGTVRFHKVDARTPEERYKYIYKYRFVPSKYRVAMSAYQQNSLEKMSDDPNKFFWSDGSKTHPLPENPITDYPKPLPDGGLQYYGFEYYPPSNCEVETIPKEEISPLFLVQRVKNLKAVQWYYKDMLDNLGLGKREKLSKVVVVKNIPEMNAILYAVKHFIKITPIKLPADLPLDADPKDCFLTEDGVFSHDPAKAIPSHKLEMSPENQKKRLDPITIRMQSFKNFQDSWELVP